MAPLTLVTVHHEGAGEPTDFARGAAGGYTYWVGPNGFTHLRSAFASFATLHYNHVSVDVCLSGDRDVFSITNNDLIRLTAIAADARARGELTEGTPTVHPHRFSFNTACPGNRTMDMWAKIVACFAAHSDPQPAPAPSLPTLRMGSSGPNVKALQLQLNYATGTHLTVDGMFGAATNQAVVNLQKFFHLPIDGVVGAKTWFALEACVVSKQKREGRI
jgi:hypothetical protein